MSGRLTRLLKEPLLQFLIIGGAIYGAYALFEAPGGGYRENVIRVDSTRINGMISAWEARWNRPPTRQEVDGLIQAYIKEDVLYRQAVAMGLNEDDPVTRRRMAQKLEFITSDLAAMQEPAEGELEQFFRDNLEEYGEPDRISFTQLFFDPDARGDATLADAERVLERLRTRVEPAGEPGEPGDRLMLQSHFASASKLDIQRQFGSHFAGQVMGLEPGQWHGPVLSGYGVHLVYVHSLEVAPPPQFEEARARVLEDWQAEKRKAFNAAFLDSLKAQYEIIVDDLPADRLLDAQTGAGGQEAVP